MKPWVNEKVVNISVTNINEFKELMNRANKEVRQLKETISELENFDIKFEFDVNKNVTSSQ